MKKLLLCVVSFVVLLASALHAQVAAQTQAPAQSQAHDITGTWQGTLHVGGDHRMVLKVSKDDKGVLKAVDYYFGPQGAQPVNASSITLDRSTFKFAIQLMDASYEGKLSADGNSITGSWSFGANLLPLTFERATPETAWEIPPPPTPLKPMAADADPSFEVATIKPNNSGKPNLQGLTMRGRNFATRNSSVSDLISFAYEVQARQIVNAPSWLNSDRYDIDAVPDQEGSPNPEQIRIMIRKLLADRFKLTFHKEKRELSAYVLTVGKGGPKLAPTEGRGNLPGFAMLPGTGGLTILAQNATLQEFATTFLQTLVLDRPVVNQTGLTGKYDFHFTFTPDESEFNGHPPSMPAQTDAANTAPNLFDAMQQQLGLKLESQKAPVDVIVIDHVEHPSPN